MTNLEQQLDDLFGKVEPAERDPRSHWLEPIGRTLSILGATHLWLAEPNCEILTAWRLEAAEPIDPDFDFLFGANGAAPARNGDVLYIVDTPGGERWFGLNGPSPESEGGLFLGRMKVPDGMSLDQFEQVFATQRQWIAAAGQLAIVAATQAQRSPVLQARLQQVVRQQQSLQIEHERIVAAILEERDARLNEQLYMERLEKDVGERTREIRAQSERLRDANHRMQRDLEAAARIQKALLPAAMPTAPGVRFGWVFRPCDELAGDCLNVFRLDERHFGLFILDVSGHGVPAALLSVTLSRVLSPLLDRTSVLKQPIDRPPHYRLASPVEVANHLNRQFPVEPELEQYFTFQYGVLDIDTKRFEFVSAGHPGPVRLPARGEPEMCGITSFPIGWFEHSVYETQVIDLQPGDRVCLYSDGISESVNAQKDHFGSERLMTSLDASRSAPIQESVEQLLNDSISWCVNSRPKDDISILAFEIDE